MTGASLGRSPAARHWLRHSTLRVRGWSRVGLADGLVLLLLMGVAWSLTAPYLRASLFIWGDHPGQFMRFWYPLAHAMPDSGHGLWGVLSWNPTWYAGYPELQFYPPGTSLLGIALHYLTLGQLSPEQLYNLLPALAFALPLFTCYAFLRVALAPLGRTASRLAGVSAGLLAVAFTPMWGGIDGVVIGLLGERLAFGFAPLVLLAGWRLVERPNAMRLVLAAIALAVLLLLHPFHAPALVLAVSLYALTRIGLGPSHSHTARLAALWMQIRWLAVWLLLAIGLIAWWLVPLLMRYSPYAATLVRATPDQVVSWFAATYVEWLWLAALPALLLLAHPRRQVQATVIVLALLPPLIIGGILFNDRILVARLHITLFDPIRFIAEYYLALILVVGCAVGAATSALLWRTPWLALVVLAILAMTLEPVLPRAWQDVLAHRQVTPLSTQAGVIQHPAFQGYWEALQNDPTDGRILFVSNYLYLAGEDGTITPTTIQSMTPYFTGREIVGGTFSHWSPVARWLWVGTAQADLLPAQVENGDNQQLFGKAWEELGDDELAAYLQRLNVTTVVANVNDEKARARMDRSPYFRRTWDNGYFYLYHITAPSGAWVEADGTAVDLLERNPRHWLIEVQPHSKPVTLTLKMSHYPLWRASVNGQPVPITMDAYGLQQITLPPRMSATPTPYQVEVIYREGWPEWSGLLLSLGTLLLVGLLLINHLWIRYFRAISSYPDRPNTVAA